MMKPILIAVLVVSLLVANGCSRKEPKLLGEPVDPSVPAVTIADIMQNKVQYHGQLVRFEGYTGGVGCIDCGGITVVEKTWRILVEPEDPSKFRIPAKKAARVRVWGVVKAEGVEEEHKEESRDAAHEKVHADLGNVEVKAKGVEFL